MELVRFPSRGGFSVRSVIAFALTVVITALLWVTLSSIPAHAAPTASWQNGDTLLYDNHGYVKADDTFKDTTGTIPDGAIIYKSTVQPGTNSPAEQKIFVLYFTPGVDPPTADSATYVEFTYNNGQLSNPQGKQEIAVAPADSSGNSGSSCAVTGVGWMICPISNFLADAMDNMFNILATMIAVKPPVLGDTSNSMYVAWNIMRSIANVAFVVAFLIIIYSQITNLGVSNYGLKKIIPRLVVAAVLVNISFYIAALAIDISNVLGYSVQNVFNIVREQTFHLTNDNINGINTNTWGAVTAAVLAGGGIVGGVYYVAAGGLYLLLPILIGVLLTIIFVVVILAARQAIIVILVIIAPLAFVANLLPNTEKLFEKWKDLFMTMLIFFPAFSLVFGGSQLAGQIIIQNAGDNIIMLIFGLAVQIAPLVITPLILKFSGSLLGRIAQIANNPRKGLIDRSRNWGERRAEHAKQRNIAQGAKLKNPSSWGAGMVRGMDYRRRRLSDKTDIWKQEATNRYEETDKYGDIHTRKTESDLNKERIHNQHAEHVEHLKTTPESALYGAAIASQSSKERAEGAQNATNAHFNRQRMIAGTALNASSDYLEHTKMTYETTDNEKNAYQASQKLTAGTRLNSAVHGLETSKARSERTQSQYSAYVNAEKLAVGTELHQEVVHMEQAKITGELSTTRVNKMVEEYKTGKLVRTGDLNTIMTDMKSDSLNLAAEKQGVTSAQYEQQRNFANAMTGKGTLTDQMLATAQGVGGDTARVRAQAQAVRAAQSLDNDALKANVELLENEALADGKNIKYYSDELVTAYGEGKTMYKDRFITDERLKAALQAQASEKNVALFERVRGNDRFDQAMVSEIIALNSTNFKIAGGFGLQDKLSLNIDEYASPEEYMHALRVQRISNLSNTNASGLSSLKFSWLGKSLSGDELKLSIDAALQDVARANTPEASKDDKDAGLNAQRALQGAYKTVRDALLNDQIRATINDRESLIREIEAELARIHGQAPVPGEPLTLNVDAATYEAELKEMSTPIKTGSADSDDDAPATPETPKADTPSTPDDTDEPK